LCVASFTLIGTRASFAGAETKPEDLPPPPGALESELGLESSPAESRSAGTHFEPIEIPFIFEGGHIIIEVSIDGGTPKPFLFDTGARHLITSDVAATLKLPVLSTTQVGGIGPKVSQMQMINVDRITIGGATLEHQKVGVTDMPNTLVDRGSRPRLAGLIGSELLSSYAVTIDYTQRTMTLHPRGFRPSSAKFSLPLTLAVSTDGLSHPSISANLDGVTGNFIVDTGSGGQILVSERFQQEHQPFASIGTVLDFLTAGGIGGPTRISMAFGKELGIGSFVVSPPLVEGIDAGSSPRGHFRTPDFNGVIGNGFLSNFIVTLDLAAMRAYFEPVPNRKHATTIYGIGISLYKPTHDAFEVLDVLKNTSAERAGIRAGDHIIQIAGQPARDLAPSDTHVFAPESLPALTVVTSDHRKLDLTYSRLLP
jgi:Aspartyl protease